MAKSNMDNYGSVDWEESLNLTFNEFVTQFIAFAPQLAATIAVLILGWIIAHALRVITRKLVRSLDSLFQSSEVTDDARQIKIRRSYALIISKLIFWMVIIFFIAVATNMLGWDLVSNWMAGIGIYIPNLVTGLLIILAGFLLGNVMANGVASAAASTNISRAVELGRIVQLVIIFTALVIGVEQIGINVGFLTNVMVVIIGVLVAGAALAFSFGAKTLVANIIGAQYLRKHCRIGEVMRIGDVEGHIIEVSQTSIVLDTDYGRAVVPAKEFQEQVCSFRSDIESVDEDVSSPTRPGTKNV